MAKKKTPRKQPPSQALEDDASNSLAGLLSGLFGDGEAGSDDEWSRVWDARKEALEKHFGPAADSVFHAMIPFEFGGSPDVLAFPEAVIGHAVVTADLSGGEEVSERAGEFVLITGGPSGAAADYLAGLVPRLLATEEPLRGRILDLAGEPDAPFDGLVVLPGQPVAEFEFLGKKWPLHLVVGVSRSDLATAQKIGAEKFAATLAKRENGFRSTFRLPAARPCRLLAEIPEAADRNAWKGASPTVLKELDLALAELRKKVESAHRRFGYGNHSSWSGDLESGRMEMVYPDGSRGGARYQIVATYLEADGSLEWVWNHPEYSEPQKVCSLALKKWGQERKLPLLTKGMIKKGASLSIAWTALAVARQLSNAEVAFAADSRGLTMCLLLDDLAPVAAET